MKQLKVGVIDLTTKTATNSLYDRIMLANLASIMPQVVATWCEKQGHDVSFVCYMGKEDLFQELPDDLDLVFIGAFTDSALLAYALSRRFQSRGAATVLGVHLASSGQPRSLPGVRERWKFVEATLRKAPLIKIVPMIGSLGCPYTCSFCIDATVPYQPLSFDVLKEDLRFLLTVHRKPHVRWHDPNFGVRFDDYMGAIEEAVPPGRIDFIAESSLSLLSEPHLERLRHNGFKAILPGIESWFDLGNKSKTGVRTGMNKV